MTVAVEYYGRSSYNDNIKYIWQGFRTFVLQVSSGIFCKHKPSSKPQLCFGTCIGVRNSESPKTWKTKTTVRKFVNLCLSSDSPFKNNRLKQLLHFLWKTLSSLDWRHETKNEVQIYFQNLGNLLPNGERGRERVEREELREVCKRRTARGSRQKRNKIQSEVRVCVSKLVTNRDWPVHYHVLVTTIVTCQIEAGNRVTVSHD